MRVLAREKKSTLYKFWNTLQPSRPKTVDSSTSAEGCVDSVPSAIGPSTAGPSTAGASAVGPAREGEEAAAADGASSSTLSSGHLAPAVAKAREELADVSKRIADINITLQHIGLNKELKEEMKRLIEKKSEIEKRLRKLEQNQRSQQKFRGKRKKAMSE